MVLKYLRISFFFLFPTGLFSQDNHIPFRNCLNEAGYFFYNQMFDSANYYFSKAEKFGYELYPMEAHLYSRTLWELGKRKKSIRIMKNLGLKYFFEHDTTYYEGIDSVKRSKILRKMRDPKFVQPKEPEFFTIMRELDQVYRGQRKNLLPDDSVSFRTITEKMNWQDSINRSLLVDYIKRNGYPGGYKQADPIVVVLLLHSTRDWFFENYQLFMDEIKNGRMNPRDFAFAFDRLFGFDKTNKVTTYNVYVNTASILAIDPELIFINRCQIGLDPYFENPNNLIFERGKTPNKSQLYTYYSEKKQNFNCSRFK